MKNPVAHEVPVLATGARPGESGGQRKLFTEEASTVLAFENGGVIRLSAAVTVGQLLFLTNKGTNREVVAQVMRKRDFRPTSCYAVEHRHYVTDIHATVLHLLGLDSRRLEIPGRKRLEVEHGRLISEILA